MAGESQSNQTVPERLTALETHMEYTVKGIDDLKKLMQDHVKHPCEKCSLADEVAVNANDITWLKRIVYSAGAITSTGIIGLIIDRFTGIIDKIIRNIP